MADEHKQAHRRHIADDHPDLPDDVVDGLAELAEINERSGLEQDLRADPEPPDAESIDADPEPGPPPAGR